MFRPTLQRMLLKMKVGLFGPLSRPAAEAQSMLTSLLLQPQSLKLTEPAARHQDVAGYLGKKYGQ